MTSPNGWDGPPTPELLAAYVDGELDGRDALLPLKNKVEAWLAANPDARADVDAQRRLRQLWSATTPAEPEQAAWNRVLEHLPSVPAAVTRFRLRMGWVAAVLCASAASLLLYLAPWAGEAPRQAGTELSREVSVAGQAKKSKQREHLAPVLDNGEVFAVATSDEIEVLRVDGQDVRALAVMDPALHRIELMGPGEAALTERPPARGVSLEGSRRPMIWARLDSEMHDD